MKTFFFTWIFLANFQVFAAEKVFKSNGVTYQLELHQKDWVSSHCLKECLALKNPQISAGISSAANPATEFCQKAQGTYKVVTDQSGLPESLCIFSDGSYIKAWDYYKKFKPHK